MAYNQAVCGYFFVCPKRRESTLMMVFVDSACSVIIETPDTRAGVK